MLPKQKHIGQTCTRSHYTHFAGIQFTSYCLLCFLLIFVNTFGQENLNTVKITTIANNTYEGKLLCVSDSMMVLWKSDKGIDWRDFHQNAERFRIADINQIAIKYFNSELFKENFGKGALLGGGTTICLASSYLLLFGTSKGPGRYGPIQKIHMSLPFACIIAIPSGFIGGMASAAHHFDKIIKIEDNGIRPEDQKTLIENTLFLSMLPNDLFTSRNEYDSKVDTPENLLYNPLAVHRYQRNQNFNSRFTVEKGKVYTKAFQNVMNAFTASGFMEGKKCKPLTSYRFCFELGIKNNIRVGLGLSEFSKEIFGDNDEWISLISTSYNIFLTYHFHPPLPIFKKSIELSTGAGLAVNSLSTEGNLFMWEMANYKTKNRVTGGYLRANIDFLISKEISFRFLAEGELMPKIHVPPKTETSPDGNKVKQLKAYDMNCSSIELSMGFGIHF